MAACAPPAALPNSHESPEALARAVMAAIERKDVTALNNLALSEQEFRDYVFPELPASRPERNLPLSYVWSGLHQKSNSALGQTLERHGGHHYVFVALRFLGETTDYETFSVHRRSEVRIQDPRLGERNVRLFGSVIEKAGRFKVFSYVVDE